MTDLVERLRSAAWAGPVPCPVCDEAADEIDLLRSLLDIEHRKNASADNCVIVNRRELEFQLLAERLQARVAELERLAPMCKEHGTGPGARSGCPYCALIKMNAVVSAIDYSMGPPNEYQLSDFDLHCNPVIVEEKVRVLVKEAARYRWLRDEAPIGTGDMASVRSSHAPPEVDAAIDAAMEASP